MPNIGNIIKGHDKYISATNTEGSLQLPTKGHMLTKSKLSGSYTIFKAKAKQTDISMTQIGLTETPFNLRYDNHEQFFNHLEQQNPTELYNILGSKPASHYVTNPSLYIYNTSSTFHNGIQCKSFVALYSK